MQAGDHRVKMTCTPNTRDPYHRRNMPSEVLPADAKRLLIKSPPGLARLPPIGGLEQLGEGSFWDIDISLVQMAWGTIRSQQFP